MTVSGDFNRSGGTFTHNSGTVALDGGDQTITGATTFNHLTKTVTAAQTLTFPSGAANAQTIEGTLTLKGTTGNLLSLRSDVSGTEWQIDPQGATRDVEFLDVQDSNNTNATTVSCTNGCVNTSGNTGWTFAVSSSTESESSSISLSDLNESILMTDNTGNESMISSAIESLFDVFEPGPSMGPSGFNVLFEGEAGIVLPVPSSPAPFSPMFVPAPPSPRENIQPIEQPSVEQPSINEPQENFESSSQRNRVIEVIESIFRRESPQTDIQPSGNEPQEHFESSSQDSSDENGSLERKESVGKEGSSDENADSDERKKRKSSDKTPA